MTGRKVFAAVGAGLVAGATVVAAVFADGLPTPLPGALAGPDPTLIQTIAAGYGLDCQPSQSADVVAEWFCLRPAGADGVVFTATYYAEPALVLVATVVGPTPFGPQADAFLRDVAVPFCPTSTPEIVGQLITDGTTQPSPAPPVLLDDATCRLELTAFQSPGSGSKLLTAFSKVGLVVPSPSPFVTPAPLPTVVPVPTRTPTPLPTVSAAAAPVSPVPDPVETEGPATPLTGPGGFATSIPAPSAVSTDPLFVAESLALAALVVLLMPFPAQLFNSTLETHYTEVRRWFRLDRIQTAAGRLAGFWDSALGIVLFIALSAVIYALLDPGLGLDAESLAQVLGLGLGLMATTLVASAAGILRSGNHWRLRALPATLIIGLVCVIISRVTGFLPGYVYGIVLGVVFARSMSRIEQGRANAIAAGVMLVAGLGAWLVLALVVNNVEGLFGIVLSTLLATVMVACLEGVVFGLLPFRFLPGEPLFATRRFAWAALLGVGAFCFFHILINPTSGYLSSTSRTPFITIVLLFVSFAALSIGFWAYFRNRPVQP